MSKADGDLLNAKLLAEGDPPDWGWDCLSRMFHVGTRVPRSDAKEEAIPYLGYINHCASVSERIPQDELLLDGRVMSLPSPEPIDDIDFNTTLSKRATCRAFDGHAISLQQVANTLWTTFGAVHGSSRQDLVEHGMQSVGYRRTSPSGGSMQSSEPYLVALNVTDLPPAIYHYRSIRHELSYVAPMPSADSICKVLCNQTIAKDLAFGVFITSRFDKLWWKYPHSRAYRVALMDVGCLLQTFQLVCTAQGIQSWPTGYFVDAEADALLKVDGVRESTLFFLGADYGDGSVARDAIVAMKHFLGQIERL